MAFDIRQIVVDSATGEPDEQAAIAYEQGLLALFAASPEHAALVAEHEDHNFTAIFLQYAMSYLGLTPPELAAADVDEVLFELFPRKVAVEPEAADTIVAELRAFWQFLARAFNLPSAQPIVAMLDDQAAQRLRRELDNPANFGMAKSMVMEAQRRGFDTSTRDGLDAWI